MATTTNQDRAFLNDVIDNDEYDELAITCDTCAGEHTVNCAWCSGSGEGQREGTLCGHCRGKGELPCPDCEDGPDGSNYDEEAAGRTWNSRQRVTAYREYGIEV
jgi:hypothetical protein